MSTNKKVADQMMQICKENNVVPRYKLVFPIYNILPKEVELAREVMKKHGMRVEIEFCDKK